MAYETASLLIPLFKAVSIAMNPDKNDTELGATLRATLKKSVKFYISKYKYFESPTLIAITFLDPRSV